MANKPLVACPKCKRKQAFKSPNAIYWCDHCRAQFDDEPDEGGSFFSDPSRRLELADEDRIRQQNRTRARINGRK